MPVPCAVALVSLFVASPVLAFPAQSAQDPVEKAKPALVTVIAYDAEGKVLRKGSGFFANKEGLVVAARHVFLGAASAVVEAKQQRHPVAGIVSESFSAGLLLAAIKPHEAEVDFLEISEEPPQAREPVVLAVDASAGVVSAVRDVPGFGKILRITQPISQETSGSPILNSKAEVVGVAMWQASGEQGTGFAASGETLLALPNAPPTPLDEWSAAAARDSVASADDDYREGLTRLFLDDYEGALSRFEQAIGKNPRHAQAWFHSGFAKGKLGHQREKIEAYRKAVEIKPDYGAAHYSLGVSYALAGERELALAEHQALASVDPPLAEKLQLLIHFIVGEEPEAHEENAPDKTP